MSSDEALFANGERLLDSLKRWSSLSEAEQESVDHLLVRRAELISALKAKDLDIPTKTKLRAQDGALLQVMRNAQKRLRNRSKQNGYGPKRSAQPARYIDQAK